MARPMMKYFGFGKNKNIFCIFTKNKFLFYYYENILILFF